MSAAVKKYLFSGFVFWIILALISGYLLFPLRKKLTFGIDLVGGTYITLDVQVDKAIEYELREQSAILESSLKDADKTLPVSKKVSGHKIIFNFDNDLDATNAQLALRDSLTNYKSSVSGTSLTYTMPDSLVNKTKSWALQSNIEVLRTRLNKLGVEEVKVAPQGERSVVVELPDIEDPAKAKEMIGTPAMLEFKIVEAEGASKDGILDEYGGEIPDGMQIITGASGNSASKKYYLVSDYSDVTGAHLREAQPQLSQGQVTVTFKLTPKGGDNFYKLTSENVNRTLAAVLDNRVISAANIQEAIRTDCQIRGGFTRERAQELCMLFKSGAFVAPVKFAEERRIGPSLGYKSIKQGLLSCAVGLGLLIIFSIFYYKLSGLLAFIALLYNLLLVLVCLSLSKAALTLPGIAGMVLTVGMAVDASILIYERIKELLAEGLSAKEAVNKGFSNAMVVILDANITTFIVGIVLFKFGTGPIQGFAVTMMIGIISTLITGMLFLRTLMNFVLDGKKVQKLSI